MSLKIGDSYIQHLIKLVRSTNYRKSQKSTVISNFKILSEIYNKDSIKNILIAPDMKWKERQLENFFEKSLEFNQISLDIIRGVTREPNPEGILAEIRLPTIHSINDVVPKGSRILFLYKLSDPGNMGTIIRSALAFNWNHVVLIGDCVDPFSFQSLKASMGAALKTRIYAMKSEKDSIKQFLALNRINLIFADKIYGSRLRSPQDRIVIPTNGSIGLCLGSESNGFEDFPLESEISNNALKLDISDNVESLNVSVCAGIFMHEINKYLVSD